MAMHLGGCATYVIMITGRWKSAAFMEYIRDEIAQFSEGVSQRMILRQNYFALQRCCSQEDFARKPIYRICKSTNDYLNDQLRLALQLVWSRLSTWRAFAIAIELPWHSVVHWV
jgi:hypothetical protein